MSSAALAPTTTTMAPPAPASPSSSPSSFSPPSSPGGTTTTTANIPLPSPPSSQQPISFPPSPTLAPLHFTHAAFFTLHEGRVEDFDTATDAVSAIVDAPLRVNPPQTRSPSPSPERPEETIAWEELRLGGPRRRRRRDRLWARIRGFFGL
ncbi:hypothetical protein K402DRAFT_424239 [Aulographum hederae CBS 113979]|uniref:Uncharacterized protein n=1 Tax=Aulographum hederae CBS 113979 TaxID=1176131 RepID=A0A6G1GQ21_9PEZI|nr:hypothetical protein K402DRAFT_424239 [Aulographum hederae CBS 113979]